MRKPCLLLIGLLAVASPAWAAYTTPTAAASSITPDGRLAVGVTFTGNAGEAPINRTFYGASLSEIQTQVNLFLLQLNTVVAASASVTPGAPLPTQAPSVTPINGATNISPTPTLSWSIPGSVSVNVALSTANPPVTPLAANVTTGSVSIANALLNSTQYFWRLQSTDSAGTVTTGPIFSFTTQAAAVSTAGSFLSASPAFAPGTAPQDVCTITGSATKSVTVSGLQVTMTQTTGGMNGWTIVKRSTVNSGGTSATVGAVPLTTGMPAATATARTYTVNPTAGTLVGALFSGFLPAPAPASVIPLDVPNLIAQSLTLGATEVIAVNFGGAALPPGLSVRCTWQWSEQ